MQAKLSKTGFTLVEILVVIAIIAILSAILLPAFFTVRGKARQSACLSNLHQIGLGVALYMQDSDGFYPHAGDPLDRYHYDIGDTDDYAPNIQDVLQPYIASKALFRCPADTGFALDDFENELKNVYPSSYEKYGTSYYYNTVLAVDTVNESIISEPALVDVLYDGAGTWHGNVLPFMPRYNVLFADAHSKSMTRDQFENLDSPYS